MTTPVGDGSNDLPVPSANGLFNGAAALLRVLREAAPKPADSPGLRVAKHCFRCLSVGAVAAATAMFVLQPGAENP